MKTYKQRTEEILQKAENKRQFNKKIRMSAIATGVCAAVVAISCVLFVPFQAEAPSVKQYQNSEYYAVIQQINQIKYIPPKYKNNYEKITDNLSNIFTPKYGEMMPPDMMESAGNNESTGSFVETTDNQTAGVSEADLIKRTDKYIFYFSADNYTVFAYTINKENTELAGYYTLRARNNVVFRYGDMQMYLTEDATRIILVGSGMQSKEETKKYTVVTSLDITNPVKIQEVGRTYLSGDYVSSRLTDGRLFLVNNFSVRAKHDFEDETSFLPQFGAWGYMQSVGAEDIICPENATSAKYAVVCEINPFTMQVNDCKALLSYSSEIYASKENLFITRSYAEKQNYTLSKAKTEISCLYYGGEGLEYKGCVAVDGSLKNQYSMDEYEGILRVVTTVNYPATNASLYCVSLSDFTIAGKAECFAPQGERVESVRFDNEKAYVCTALVIVVPTDPVFVFDLSNPAEITFVDTGTIEGYSSSLVNFTDGYLLGIGYGNSWGLKIEIYEETATAVEIVATYEADASFSEEYKSYLIDRANGFIGMGVSGYFASGKYGDGYMLFAFDGYEIVEFAFIEIAGAHADKRAVIIDGYLYVFSGSSYEAQKLYAESEEI